MMKRLRGLPFANLARVCALLSLFSVGFAFVGERWVEAQLAELLHGLGTELMAFPTQSGARPRAVYVNGVRFLLRTATIPASTEKVLDHYEALCRGRDGGLSARLAELSNGFVVYGSTTTQRTGGPGGGHVSCLDLGPAVVDTETLVDRLVLFAQTGDTAEVGALRYAYARPSDDEPSQTFVLTMWTEGPVDLFELLPTNARDVPGRDPEGLPRAPGLQRILSAWESDEPYGLTLYTTRSRLVRSLETFYRREFSKLGWKPLQPATDKPLVVDRTRVLGFERNGQMVTVLLEDVPDGSQTAMVLTTDFL